VDIERGQGTKKEAQEDTESEVRKDEAQCGHLPFFILSPLFIMPT
jgi:hypothetical protein